MLHLLHTGCGLCMETITSYKYLWTSIVAGELATLAFYVFTGLKFRPEAHNPYFVIADEEKEAAAEQLKLEDEFELRAARIFSNNMSRMSEVGDFVRESHRTRTQTQTGYWS